MTAPETHIWRSLHSHFMLISIVVLVRHMHMLEHSARWFFAEDGFRSRQANQSYPSTCMFLDDSVPNLLSLSGRIPKVAREREKEGEKIGLCFSAYTDDLSLISGLLGFWWYGRERHFERRPPYWVAIGWGPFYSSLAQHTRSLVNVCSGPASAGGLSLFTGLPWTYWSVWAGLMILLLRWLIRVGAVVQTLLMDRGTRGQITLGGGPGCSNRVHGMAWHGMATGGRGG